MPFHLLMRAPEDVFLVKPTCLPAHTSVKSPLFSKSSWRLFSLLFDLDLRCVFLPCFPESGSN